MSDLAETLKMLKLQLNTIEVQYEKNETTLKKREDVHQRLENKLDNLIQINNKTNQVFINAGGKIFQTTRESIMNSIHPNILQSKVESNSNGSTPDDALFVNIPKDYFKIILDVMRRLNTSELRDSGSFSCQLLEQEKNKLTVELKKSHLSRSNLNTFLKKFFNDDESVLQDVRIADKRKMNAYFRKAHQESNKNKNKKK